MKILLDGRLIADVPRHIVGPGDQISIRYGGEGLGEIYYPEYQRTFLVLDVWRPLLEPARSLIPEVVNVVLLDRVWRGGGCYWDRETNLLVFPVDHGEEGVPL